MCIHIHIKYVRSSLAVSFFIATSESKRSPGTNFAAEEGIYLSDIRLYSCKVSNLESNTNRIFIPSLLHTTREI